MANAVRFSESEFNPEARNFDINAVAERLDAEPADVDADFDMDGLSKAAKVRRMLSHSRFN